MSPQGAYARKQRSSPARDGTSKAHGPLCTSLSSTPLRRFEEALRRRVPDAVSSRCTPSDDDAARAAVLRYGGELASPSISHDHPCAADVGRPDLYIVQRVDGEWRVVWTTLL